MKRIINNITYNTATATLLGTTEEGSGDERGVQVSRTQCLYETRHNRFFLHTHTVTRHKTADDGWVPSETNACDPLTRDAAQRWAKTHGVVLPTRSRAVQPDTDAGVLSNVRVPRSLKEAAHGRAKDEGRSFNEWMIRAMERVLSTGPNPR